MRKYNININIIRVIENLYDKDQSSILFNGSKKKKAGSELQPESDKDVNFHQSSLVSP